jgi:hypothetical protein
MSALLRVQAAAADRQLAAASQQLASLRRLRAIVPVTILGTAGVVGVIAATEHLLLPVMWWVVFTCALPAIAWWILEAASRSQRRAVLRAHAIRDGAWAAAARRRLHLTSVNR